MVGSTEYKNNWQKVHLDRINLTMSKGYKEVVQTHANARGESTNAFINRAICEAIERDLQMDELEPLAKEMAAQNGVPIEDIRAEAQIIDALTALKPIIPNIEKIYLSRRYPKQKESRLGNMNDPKGLRR